MPLQFRLSLLVLAVITTGCSLTPEYGCRAPDGVTCMSASEIYDRDGRGEVIRPKVEREDKKDGEEIPLPPAPRRFSGPTSVQPGDPIFREPHRLRVWLVDWEDMSGVYHPNHYLYLRVDDGEWLLPAMRERLLENPDGDAE
jgi:conjugal transfer pilus assembly protein TraV